MTLRLLFVITTLFVYAHSAVTYSKPQSKAEDDYCYSLDDNPDVLFGTKTSYELTRGDSTNVNVPEGKVNVPSVIDTSK